VSSLALLGVGAGLLLLLIALETPERMKSGIEEAGAGGGVEDARLIDAAEVPAPAEDVAAEAEPIPLENPANPASAAPALTAPARTKAYAEDPKSPEMTRFAMKGITAMASA